MVKGRTTHTRNPEDKHFKRLTQAKAKLDLPNCQEIKNLVPLTALKSNLSATLKTQEPAEFQTHRVPNSAPREHLKLAQVPAVESQRAVLDPMSRAAAAAKGRKPTPATWELHLLLPRGCTSGTIPRVHVPLIPAPVPIPDAPGASTSSPCPSGAEPATRAACHVSGVLRPGRHGMAWRCGYAVAAGSVRSRERRSGGRRARCLLFCPRSLSMDALYSLKAGSVPRVLHWTPVPDRQRGSEFSA